MPLENSEKALGNRTRRHNRNLSPLAAFGAGAYAYAPLVRLLRRRDPADMQSEIAVTIHLDSSWNIATGHLREDSRCSHDTGTARLRADKMQLECT